MLEDRDEHEHGNMGEYKLKYARVFKINVVFKNSKRKIIQEETWHVKKCTQQKVHCIVDHLTEYSTV